MNIRALRTTAVQSPKTQGERIRYARLDCNLSQAQLARAVGLISRRKVTKSLVSQWERDAVTNPNNANMLALQAVTGFSVQWLVNGRGPQKVAPPGDSKPGPGLDIDTLRRAMAAAAAANGGGTDQARMVAELYELLRDSPDVSPAILNRLALAIANK